jgi:hypothetical protein
MKMDHVEKLLQDEVEKQEKYILECEREIYYLELQLHSGVVYKDDLVKKWKDQLEKHLQRLLECLNALDLIKRYQYEEVN